MVAILILPILSLLLFLFPDWFGKRAFYFAMCVIAIVVISLLSIAYIHPGPGTFANILRIFALVSIATLISAFFIYLSGRRAFGRFKIVYILAIAVIAASLAYVSMYGFTNIRWNGVDELAANYYSAYLTLHLINPYTSSMQPIYSARDIFPTVLLNGSYEDFYAYPAFSFIVYMPFVYAGIGRISFMPFIAILIFFAISAAILVYFNSGRNKGALIPIAIWLFACYTLTSVSNVFLVSIFSVLAYMFIKRSFVSGIMLGIAAAVSQLAWFALPFFYLLTLTIKGKLKLQILGTAASFLAINIYFIAAAPLAFISNIFGIMGTHSLVFFGQNIAQFFYAFYPVSQLYISALSITVLLFSMLAYYLYPKSSRMLIATAPMFIFFLAWRNISIYGLAYVPLALAVYYGRNHIELYDRIKNRRYLAYAIVVIAIVFAALAVYSHTAYTAHRLLSINRIYPVLGVSGYGYYMRGFVANITNYASSNETVTFYMVSRSPNAEAYLLGSLQPQIAAHSTRNYSVDFTLPLVNNRTKVIVFAFDKDYVTSTLITLSNLR
ncbi:MAG: hypothetical protein QXT36_01445 [Candidatus Micrarchaeaceae archaeon]